ncbi:hypothetical protein [Kitasatospora sp. NPDC018619]|uniref:hypothetical protein n=1 Tax=unclassified Kitasatospora TaxID=2633591 RepID=UPI0037AC06DB
MSWKDRWRRSEGASVEPPSARWPSNWSELAPDERIGVVVAAIADGTTARPDQLIGLTDDGILQVEDDQRTPIAGAYRTFLAQIGGGAGRFMQGTDVYYPRILGLRTAARELLEERGSTFEFGESDRVFSMHQGYQFDFLRGSGADPEVWSYSEGENDDLPVLNFAHFTDWLRAVAEEEIPVWARLAASRPRNLTYFRIHADGSRTEQ